MERACALVNHVHDFRESIYKDCDTICRVAREGTSEELQATMTLIAEKVRE